MSDGDPIICQGCGIPTGAVSPDTPVPSHCGDCPPWRCDGCGQMCSMAEPCGCWIPLDGMDHADLKAIFAASDLSLSPPRGITDED